MSNAPGKSFGKGLSLPEIMEMFPTEEAAGKWFESIVWANGRTCPHCGSCDTKESECETVTVPYHCRSCQKQFSVRKGTVMEGSPLPYRKWVLAIHLHMTSLKGVSSMKLHRDINVTQKTAWFMLQRIRETFRHGGGPELFDDPVEVDETFVGGLEANRHRKDRLNAGRGGVGKSTVAAVKDRETGKFLAKVVPDRKGETLRPFVEELTLFDTIVYTDGHAAHAGLDRLHGTVNHGVGECVRGMAHVNGVEGFRATLKRAIKGVYHKVSRKRLQGYVTDFAGRHEVREWDTIDQLEHVVGKMAGRRLRYDDLIAGNGLASGARPF